jgi:cytochrome c oxidase subunit III
VKQTGGVDVIALDSRRDPQPNRVLIPSGVLGMLLFVFTEVMLFAGFISAHWVVRAGSTLPWPPPGQPRLPLIATILNSGVLLFSGGALVLAHLAFRRQGARPADARTPLLVALVCGTFFVLFQGYEWVRLIAQGLTLTSSPYGSFFYVIVGTHALHAVGAILAVLWAYRRLVRGVLTANQLYTVETFWYFVVLVWPWIFLRVYL